MDDIRRRLDYCRNAKTSEDCFGCPYDDGVCGSSFMSDAFCYIKYLEAAQPKWISVEERLPDDGKYIVCTAKGSVYCTRFKAFGCGGSFQTDINTHITHWMPLPEPPKEE
jgi:hypothetical protein